MKTKKTAVTYAVTFTHPFYFRDVYYYANVDYIFTAVGERSTHEADWMDYVWDDYLDRFLIPSLTMEKSRFGAEIRLNGKPRIVAIDWKMSEKSLVAKNSVADANATTIVYKVIFRKGFDWQGVKYAGGTDYYFTAICPKSNSTADFEDYSYDDFQTRFYLHQGGGNIDIIDYVGDPVAVLVNDVRVDRVADLVCSAELMANRQEVSELDGNTLGELMEQAFMEISERDTLGEYSICFANGVVVEIPLYLINEYFGKGRITMEDLVYAVMSETEIEEVA